jgi:hypothetical protein
VGFELHPVGEQAAPAIEVAANSVRKDGRATGRSVADRAPVIACDVSAPQPTGGFVYSLIGTRAVILRNSPHEHGGVLARVSTGLRLPLGRHSVAGVTSARRTGCRWSRLPVVEAVGRAELWVAFAAWPTVFAATVWHDLVTVVRAPRVGAGVRRPTIGVADGIAQRVAPSLEFVGT